MLFLSVLLRIVASQEISWSMPAPVVLDQVALVERTVHIAVRPDALAIVVVYVIVSPRHEERAFLAADDLRAAGVIVRIEVPGIV